ncbi:MAG: hypothetical protein CRN43_06540 [Candidatus Nephrothrix sp. EaCA]|nr:MAG: hypothetical protein CRN43_06540 [Candidatus Nephrothrix sp. EaCA]
MICWFIFPNVRLFSFSSKFTIYLLRFPLGGISKFTPPFENGGVAQQRKILRCALFKWGVCKYYSDN